MIKIKKIVKILILLLASIPFVSHGQDWSVSNIDKFGLPDAYIGGSGGILSNLLNWLLGLLAIIGIIGFVISGYQYLTSAGDENQIETAKRTMKYSIIGVAVGISGWIIVLTIHFLLSGMIW